MPFITPKIYGEDRPRKNLVQHLRGFKEKDNKLYLKDISGNNLDALITNSSCLNITNINQEIIFDNTLDFTNFTNLTYSGTCTCELDTVNNKIVITTIGTLYNIKFEDLINNISVWIPCSEGLGIIIHDVLDNEIHGELINNITWTTQDEFHYNLLNGCSDDSQLYVWPGYLEYNNLDIIIK